MISSLTVLFLPMHILAPRSNCLIILVTVPIEKKHHAKIRSDKVGSIRTQVKMVGTGLHSNPELVTVRCTILKPGVRRRETPLEAGREENCRAAFLRGSAVRVER